MSKEWEQTATDLEIVERFRNLTTRKRISHFTFVVSIRGMRDRLYKILVDGLAAKNPTGKTEMSDQAQVAELDGLIHDAAYEAIKQSALWDSLQNGEVDAKADELAGELERVISEWIEKEEER